MVLETPDFQKNFLSVLNGYVKGGRDEAARNLASSYAEVRELLLDPSVEFSDYPKKNQELSRCGMRWVECGRYWFSYLVDEEVFLTGFFLASKDIPSLIRAMRLF